MSTENVVAVAPDFDPYVQSFTLLFANGESFTADMATIDYLRLYGVRITINYGSQIGASILLLLVLMVLTKREKRRSSIFIMNALCLAINAIRSILQCLYFTGNYWNPYALLAGDAAHLTSSDFGNTIASNTMTLLLVICIMVSLSLQVWVVCITTQRLQRLTIMSVTSVLALIAVGYRFAVTVISNHRALSNEGMDLYQRLLTTMTIFQAVAIWAYCAVFTFKLGYALIQRRKLGMTQFGPMQIIFIMGCQTMIIPAMFSVLQFWDKVPEFGSQTLTIVCIFLPLSAIWAGVIASDTSIGASGADAHQRLLRDQFGRSTIASSTGGKTGRDKNSTVASTSYTNSGKDPESPTTPMAPHRTNSSVDDGAIHVDREWSVEKDAASNHC